MAIGHYNIIKILGNVHYLVVNISKNLIFNQKVDNKHLFSANIQHKSALK